MRLALVALVLVGCSSAPAIEPDVVPLPAREAGVEASPVPETGTADVGTSTEDADSDAHAGPCLVSQGVWSAIDGGIFACCLSTSVGALCPIQCPSGSRELANGGTDEGLPVVWCSADGPDL